MHGLDICNLKLGNISHAYWIPSSHEANRTIGTPSNGIALTHELTLQPVFTSLYWRRFLETFSKVLTWWAVLLQVENKFLVCGQVLDFCSESEIQIHPSLYLMKGSFVTKIQLSYFQLVVGFPWLQADAHNWRNETRQTLHRRKRALESYNRTWRWPNTQ